MITSKKIGKGCYNLYWDNSETGYTIIHRGDWVLTNFDDEVLYTASTKAQVLDYARNLIDYN